jgi:hypothetical protein
VIFLPWLARTRAFRFARYQFEPEILFYIRVRERRARPVPEFSHDDAVSAMMSHEEGLFHAFWTRLDGLFPQSSLMGRLIVQGQSVAHGAADVPTQ